MYYWKDNNSKSTFYPWIDPKLLNLGPSPVLHLIRVEAICFTIWDVLISNVCHCNNICLAVAVCFALPGTRSYHVSAIWCQSRSVEHWSNCLPVSNWQSSILCTNTTSVETVLWTQRHDSAEVTIFHISSFIMHLPTCVCWNHQLPFFRFQTDIWI